LTPVLLGVAKAGESAVEDKALQTPSFGDLRGVVLAAEGIRAVRNRRKILHNPSSRAIGETLKIFDVVRTGQLSHPP
jgi:hypothetical protein